MCPCDELYVRLPLLTRSYHCDQKFLTMFRPDYEPSTLWYYNQIYGGVYNTSAPGSEAVRPTLSSHYTYQLTSPEQNLDMQYTVGLATDVHVDFISVGSAADDDGAVGFLDTANYVLSDKSNAFVMTTSYGKDESAISPGVYEYVHMPTIEFAAPNDDIWS